MVPNFIVVDDDEMTLYLCSMLIRKTLTNASILTFAKPEDALLHIQQNYPSKENTQTILLLDTNMTHMSGWDVIDQMASIEPSIMHQFSIYVQSSSVEIADMEKAAANPYITDYIAKPLTKEFLTSLL